MRRSITSHLLLLPALLVGCQMQETDSPPARETEEEPGAAAEAPAGAEVEAARDVVYGFHQALAAGDSTRALALLHPDAVVYEGGHAETVEEYRTGHLAADIDFAAAVTREVLHEEVLPLDGAALYLARSQSVGALRGREIDSLGAETILLVREGGPGAEWRIRHVHWSNR